MTVSARLGLHVTPMLGYSMEMFGGLKSLTRESAAYYP